MTLQCRHFPGSLNGAADALSCNALSSFQRLVLGASRNPRTRGFGYKDSGPLEKLGALGVCQDSTSATVKRLEDSVIRTLGHCKSLTYLEYVRIPHQQLASYSTMLC